MPVFGMGAKFVVMFLSSSYGVATVDSPTHAAEVFGERFARRVLGRRAYLRRFLFQSMDADGRAFSFECCAVRRCLGDRVLMEVGSIEFRRVS
jgi:hypothetical protein